MGNDRVSAVYDAAVVAALYKNSEVESEERRIVEVSVYSAFVRIMEISLPARSYVMQNAPNPPSDRISAMIFF